MTLEDDSGAAQTARLLALLAVNPAAEQQIRHGRWAPFIADSLASDDCKLSSHAARAHLNLLSARAARGGAVHQRR